MSFTHNNNDSMRKLTLFVLSAAMLSGCATVNKQSIGTQGAAALKNQSLAQTTRSKPDFAAMTAGKAMFALVGAFAMISEGNDIINKNNVDNPADAIAGALARGLAEKHGAQYAPSSMLVATNDASKIAAAAKDKARFVIDVETLNWSFGYFASAPSHYRVIYSARARLIDVEKNAVVAEGACRHFPDDTKGAPTYDELTANQAALLKSTLAEITGACIKTLETEMFI